MTGSKESDPAAKGAPPLVVCIHHPARLDLESLRAALRETPRPVDLRLLPLKESIKLRRARLAPPVPSELLAEAPQPDEAIREAWREAEVLLTIDLPESWLEQMPRLRWVQAYSAGVEQFPLDGFRERGIALANAAGAGAPAIAEFVMGRLVEVFRNLRGIEAMQRAGAFHRPGGRTLAGGTMGIVGLGAIGSEVARLGRAFGMRIVATRRRAKTGDASELADAIYGPEDLERLLAESDVVVLSAPATPETENLLNAGRIESMKPGAVLCNVARGALVDEAALVRALETDRLGAAILDVTRQEPLPSGDPLWTAPNVYLSPHASIPPGAYDDRLLALFVANLRADLAGGPLTNRVDLAARKG